jgi:hypothetical protein
MQQASSDWDARRGRLVGMTSSGWNGLTIRLPGERRGRAFFEATFPGRGDTALRDSRSAPAVLRSDPTAVRRSLTRHSPGRRHTHGPFVIVLIDGEHELTIDTLRGIAGSADRVSV